MGQEQSPGHWGRSVCSPEWGADPGVTHVSLWGEVGGGGTFVPFSAVGRMRPPLPGLPDPGTAWPAQLLQDCPGCKNNPDPLQPLARVGDGSQAVAVQLPSLR